MKTIVYCLLFTVFCLQGVFALQPQLLFKRANQFYLQKEYAKAIASYDTLLNANYESADLYFNLGNAYFKIGDNTRAVLSYERAKKLDPNDEDIDFNLRLANLRVADKTEPLPQLFFARWWKNRVGNFSSEQWGIYLLISIWLALLLGAVCVFTGNIFLRRFSFFTAAVVLFIAALFSCFSYSQYRTEQKIYAIVLSPNAYIKSAPDEKSTDLFILHEGVKIEVKDEVSGWNKIRLSDGKEGWIMKETLENI